MLNRILNFSLKNRLLILLGAVILSIAGLQVARTMNVDVFPDLSAPTVTLLTEAHGMESIEVEQLVTYHIETAMNGSPGVRRIRSSSSAGISIVWIEFDWGTEIYKARQIVSERIPIIREKLPSDASMPTMAPISSIMGEVMLLGITSDSLSPMELRTLADWTISPQLKSVGGIANVIVIGGDYKQYQVNVSPEKLKYYNISLQDVHKAVSEANLNVSGGVINDYGNQYLIKGNGRAKTVEDLQNSMVKYVNNRAVLVRDVATVVIGHSDKIGDGSLNASESVILTISKQPDVNTLKLTEQLDEVLDQLAQTLPETVEIKSNIFRQADFIESSVSNLNRTLLEGAFFVILVLIIFLMNWRTTIISLLAIPISLLVTVLVLDALGYTINTMSLGGMAIAIGALVDDAIIDVENVFKRLRENVQLPIAERSPVLDVVRSASIEIRSSITIATLIIIVSFVPLFFLGGMEGRLLQPLGIAFVASVLTSLVVAVTLTPVLCTYLLTNEAKLSKQAQGTGLERYLSHLYRKTLTKVLKYTRLTLALTVILFVSSIVVLDQLGRSFLPEFNEGSLVISVVGVPGMSLDESNKTGKLVEQLLLEFEEIKVVTRRTGRAEMDEHAQGVNASEIDAPFTLKNKTKEDFFEEVRHKLSVVPGVNITLGQPIAHRIDHMLSGTRSNIAIKIFGDHLGRLYAVGKEVERLVKPINGITDVALDQQIEVPEIRIIPKQQMLSAYGISVNDLMHQVEIGIAGEKAGEIIEGQRYFNIVVRLEKEYRNNINDVGNIPIALPNGQHISLLNLAHVKSVSSPNTVSRENVQRKIVIAANVSNRDLKSVVDEIKTRVSTGVELPIGYTIEYGGQYESEVRASRLLLIASLVALLVILLLLFVEFKSVKLAVVVLLNLPLALIGGIFIIFFTSGIISIASTIGLISLFGIATRNGMLLISRYENLKAEGNPIEELIVSGAQDRLNPILMTAFTTGLALIPLALKAGEAGSEIQSPMAIVILGGLLTATLFNLIVIPCVYSLTNEN